MNKINKWWLAVLLPLALIILACENSDDLADEEEHFNAVGMVLIDSGVEIFRYFEGEILTPTDNHMDTLIVPVGLTAHWEMKFLNEQEELIEPPDDPDKYLGWVIGDTSLVEFYFHEGEENGFEFHLNGKIVGETTLEFRVMHGEHYDYHTLPLPLSVRNLDGTHGVPVRINVYDEESGTLLAWADDATAGTASGMLSVAAGETSDHLETRLVDAQNREFQPEVPPHALNVQSNDTNVVTVIEPQDPEFWSFHIVGVVAGETSLHLQLLHDDTVGVDFTAIPVEVTEP